ncbi:MAG: nucleotide exchange factor GrpE [candidate division FCPU426 bacterium]
MWYDNPEDEAPKSAPHPQAQEHGKVATNNPFPGSQDPTKAFGEEVEDLPGGEATGDELTALRAKLKELDEKANLNYDRYLRALAELENYKKRVGRERAELMRYAGEDLLLEILPVLDNLERTLAHAAEATEVKKITEGVELIHRQFVTALEKLGITRIAEAPCAFNPAIHQALQRVEDKSIPDDTVVEILQKGYTLNGKVVRPAMVKVAKH